MDKQISCGFLIFDKKSNNVLGCHPYGRSDDKCDIPKGMMEPGESYIETALRELNEETGLTKDALEDIVEIGRIPYNRRKDLYVFIARCDIDMLSLTCSSVFESNNKTCPEVDRYVLGKTDIFFPNLQKAIEENVIHHDKESKS